MTSLFSDASSDWESVPQWVQFFMHFGRVIRESTSDKRTKKIVLISAPCESVGAGLIALGAHVQALRDPLANDVDGYFDSLVSYATQYLNGCSKCHDRCNPNRARCGYDREVDGTIKSISQPVHTFQICDVGSAAERHVTFNKKVRAGRNTTTVTLLPSNAHRYQIPAEPPPAEMMAGEPLVANPYTEIVPDAEIISENLQRIYSGICFAGRTAGESVTRGAYDLARFRCASGDFSIARLLTVYSWGASNEVSRMLYFNPRTREFDRRVSSPQLVVADGHESFLRVLDDPHFQRSSVVGLFHRAIERDKLDGIQDKLNSLRQWYHVNTELQHILQTIPVPRGVTMALLRK